MMFTRQNRDVFYLSPGLAAYLIANSGVKGNGRRPSAQRLLSVNPHDMPPSYPKTEPPVA
eukprot:3657650-Alexandrium_andersonii.AAC.1